jgi:hypothetical protein
MVAELLSSAFCLLSLHDGEVRYGCVWSTPVSGKPTAFQHFVLGPLRPVRPLCAFSEQVDQPWLTPSADSFAFRCKGRLGSHPSACEHEGAAVMSSQEMSCAKCTARMEEGVILDYAHSGRVNVASWMAGLPEKGWLGGLKIVGRQQVPLHTFRCTGCGYLESYAR